MVVNLKVIKDAPKRGHKDISDGTFLVKGNNVWVVKDHPTMSKWNIISLGNFHVEAVDKIHLQSFFASWEDVEILFPKQVNINIGFQWRP